MTPETGAHRPTPFVLLHGGRHGGWCWRDVARRLQAAGHEVHSPTLTGLGDRAHLLTPDVGLHTHVRDLVATVEYTDLDDAVLVGHSYGGMVLSGAMAHIAHRIRRLVLIDAHLPRTGESVFDMIGEQRAAAMTALADQGGEGWYIPPAGAARYGVTDPAAAAWVEARMTAQPLRSYREPVGDTTAAWNHPALFVECVPSSLEEHVLQRARDRAQHDPTFEHRVCHWPHDAMVTDPDAVTDLLLEAALVPAPEPAR